MRSLILFLPILFAWFICSCRSSRSSEARTTGSSALTGDFHQLSKDSADFFSFVTSTREADIFGVRFEFYPPDSVRPSDRPALKSLTVDKIKGKENTQAVTSAETRASVEESAAVDAESSLSSQTAEEHKADVLRPPAWLFVAVALALALVAGFFWLRRISGRI